MNVYKPLLPHNSSDTVVALHANLRYDQIPHLLIIKTHCSVKVFGVRNDVIAPVELTNLQAIVAKLWEAIPVVCLILQQEDRKFARGGAAVRVRMFN